MKKYWLKYLELILRFSFSSKQKSISGTAESWKNPWGNDHNQGLI